jgi:prepilin peptidase CpaA
MLSYFLIAAVIVTAVAAWTDARTGRIPNWLTFGALAVALVWHFFVGFAFTHSWRGGLLGLGGSLFGALLCVAVPAFMYWRGAIGGGDLKLFAALGALCHPLIGIEMEMYAFIAAALIAPAKLAYDGLLFKTLGRSLALLWNPFRKPENRTEIPAEMMTWYRLGPAIFIGAGATLLSHWGEL